MAKRAYSVSAVVLGLLGAAVLTLYLTAQVAAGNGEPRPLPGVLGIRWAAPELLLGVHVSWFIALWDAVLALRPDFRSRRVHRPLHWRDLWSLVLAAVAVVPILGLPRALAWLRVRYHPQLSAGYALLMIAAVCVAVGLTWWIAYRVVIEFTANGSELRTAEPEQRSAQG